jgi:hypothetical protein
MFKTLKYPVNGGNFYRIDMIDMIVKEEFEKMAIDNPVDRLITYPANNDLEFFFNIGVRNLRI